MDILSLNVAETFGLMKIKGKYGIEIELEGENLPARLQGDKWGAKVDGSLRDGMEYVSRPTDTPRDDVRLLASQLELAGAVINPSYRCSTHIHYNFTGKTFKDVIGIIIAWNIVEPLMLSLMPPGRDGSIFCMSAYDTGDLPVHFSRFCEELKKKFQNAGFHAVCRQKYASLNLTRLNDLGTVEFRIFPPSVDPEAIKKWTKWIDNLVNMVTATPADAFSKFVHEAEKRPVDFVKNVFGELPIPEDQVSAWIDLGCRTGYELVRIYNQSMKMKPKAEKKTVADEWFNEEAVAFREADMDRDF